MPENNKNDFIEEASDIPAEAVDEQAPELDEKADALLEQSDAAEAESGEDGIEGEAGEQAEESDSDERSDDAEEDQEEAPGDSADAEPTGEEAGEQDASIQADADMDIDESEPEDEPQLEVDPFLGRPVDAEAEAAEELPFDRDGVLAPDYDKEQFLGGGSDDWVDDDQTDYYRYGDKMHNVRDQVVNTDVASGGLGRHGRPKASSIQPMDEHQRRSRRMRRVLTVVAILLIALLAALAYFGYQLLRESSSVSRQQASAPAATEVGEAASKEEATKEVETAEKKTSAPDLMALLDKTPEEAVKSLGDGAIITLDTAVDEAGSAVKKRQSVALTSEPVDSKSGTPTVYLGMDSAGKVIQAGYSAATNSLGYGTMSFADAVTDGRIIEKTLREAGLQVKDGVAKLPDSSSYTTYADDGKTLVKEQCTFEGKATQDGLDCEWSAVLLYNYTAANASGNLADTVRTIFVYIDLPQPAAAASSQPASSSTAAPAADASAAPAA